MADPLPYYRVLRDEHPVYYVEKWDTYALSRFSDIWQVLEINDGTFVASEGTLPAAAVLADHNDGPVPDPPLHPMPFHANFDAPIYDGVRRCTSGQFRPKSVAKLADRIRALANERLDELLPRGTFDLTQEYGGIVAASVVCELLGLPVDLAPEVLATVNAGSLAEPGSGVEVANARPGYLEYLVPIVERRRADGSDGELPDRRQSARVPVAGRLRVQRHGGGRPDARRLHRRHRNRAEDRRARTVGVGPAARPDGCGAGRSRRQRAQGARGDDPVLRARSVVRPHAAQAVHHPRHHDRTRASGSSRCSASANRDEREYADPDEFIWDRPIERLLAFGRGQHFCLGVHLARLEIAIMVSEWLKRVPDYRILGEAASRPPSSFQWGWNNIPVEV